MHPIFQHDLVYTRIPIFTISIDLLLGNISGNYIFFGVPRPKGHPPRCFNARRKWISSASRVLPTAKPSNVAKAPRPRRAVGQNLRCSVQNLKYLDCSDLPQKRTRLTSCPFLWVTPPAGRLHPSGFQCSGQQSRPCAEVLPVAKRSYGAPAPPARRPVGWFPLYLFDISKHRF